MQPPLDNSSVIALLKGGDQGVLRRIYKETGKEFLSWIYTQAKISNQEAEEIFQDSLLVFYEKMIAPAFSLSSHWKTFLFAIGKNKLREFLRRNQRAVSFEESTHDRVTEAEDDIEVDESTTLVIKCIEELGAPCKDLILAYYYHTLSLEEASLKLGYKNANSAKNQKFKCMQRLKELFLQRYRPEP